MNNNQDDGLWKLLLFSGIGYGIYLVVNAIVAAVTAFLFGLVTIALIAAGILAVFFVFRYVTDKQYGEQKRIRQIEKWERERRATITLLPKHLREHADQYYKDKQQGLYELNPQSRLEMFIERIRKWRRGGES